MKKTLLIVLTFTMLTANLFAQDEIKINDDIVLTHLEDSVFIHTSFYTLPEFGRFSSNGLVIIKNGEAIIADTPMDNEKTEQLLTYLGEGMNVKTVKFIIGHFHDDCMGGIDYMHSKKIESIACTKTMMKCKELNLTLPKTMFRDSMRIDLNGKELFCWYFGGGHSIDNIVVWIPANGILFGGCLIKSLNSNNLGNLSDAIVNDWSGTVLEVVEAFPNVKTVVPGHGRFGDKALLVHTIDLVEKFIIDNNENHN